MKTIVTHNSVDLDAVTSVWLIKRFLPGWQDATYAFVPAGEKMNGQYTRKGGEIEHIFENEVIHVDTGMGALDHHQTDDKNVSAASLTLEYVLKINHDLAQNEEKVKSLKEIISIVVDNDHFQEVYFPDPNSLVYDISLVAIIDGLKMVFPKDDLTAVEFASTCLDSILRVFENRQFAEKEIKENGREFASRWGKAIAIETANDAVMKIAQKNGFIVVVRRDPKTGSLRIKARPSMRSNTAKREHNKNIQDVDIDLTDVYEKLKTMDPEATWFLHASKRMVLNGSSKNPNSVPSTLSIEDAMKALS